MRFAIRKDNNALLRPIRPPMKINISQTPLNANGEEPKNLLVRTKRATKTEAAINSANALVFDRGNSSVTATFEIERAHPTPGDAEVFALSHAAQIEAMLPADLEFCAPETGKAVSLPDCALSEIRISANGAITNSKYEFKARKASHE